MYETYIKRILDILLAVSALIILALPLLLVIIWVKLDSRGPVLFKQLRSGKNKVPFTVYKFRSMSTDAPNDSPTNLFMNSHSYITRSGKILRKLSIDELPQLFNVIKGDMSIVGPRPVVLREINLLDLRDRVGANSVKPGITGLAQINGRDEIEDFRKAQLDGMYVSKLGIWMDFNCLLGTLRTVIFVKGQKEGFERNSDVTESIQGAI